MLQAAKSLLKSIGQVSQGMSGNANPIVQIAKNLTISALSQQGVAMLEAAAVDSAISGTTVNQEIILTKAQFTTIDGESKTAVTYWKEAIADNKNMNKQTFDLSKTA